ncbi:YciI family protein [Actinocrispum sp. NPDC049592]|uniref:YciI family protein n=1 Tax=Actinocrispum sp. NPDC049592 TaxID=3154835 RepID=UPI0034447AE3
MLLIYNCEPPKPGEPGFEEALKRVNSYADELRRRGVFVSGHPLEAERTARTVTVREGRTLVTDGPFTETHEHLGGYYLLDCETFEEAVELAGMCPLAEVGSIEVRPVAGIPGLAEHSA